MLRIICFFLCVLFIVYAAAEFSDLCLCTNRIDDEEIVQTLDKTQLCVPVYLPDKAFDEIMQTRRKRSTDDTEESWPQLRRNRGREIIKTIHLSSSFTPRLGRRRAGSRMRSDPIQHVINLKAGTAFTPRLGRRVQEPQMN